MKVAAEQVAGEVLEVVPGVMRVIREQMRQHRGADLTITQFRVLAFLDRNAGASLSDAADHIGLALPSMSRMVDGLVERKLLVREFDTVDRRRMILTLSPRGHSILTAARADTRTALTALLEGLSPSELQTVVAAMGVLRPIFLTRREGMRAERRKDGSA